MPAQDSLYWRGRLEAALAMSGASGFGYAWNGNTVRVFFWMERRQCSFDVALPDRSDDEFNFTAARRVRLSDRRSAELYEHATRDRWRIVAQLMEAKFEAVQAGIVEAAAEFGQYAVRMPMALLPGEETSAAPAVSP